MSNGACRCRSRPGRPPPSPPSASPEAFGRFVDGTYEFLLGRAPDAGGRAYWVARLVGGDVEADLVAAIAATDEGQLRLTQDF